MSFRSIAFAIAVWAQCTGSLATTVTSHYSPLGSNAWSVEFTVLNDGPLAEVGGFTIFFPETEFAGLSLNGSPATWDSLVIQPDLGLPAAGFLDAFAIATIDRLAIGDAIGGFRMEFSFRGQQQPAALAFDIVDSSYNAVASGQTLATYLPPPAVPEPSSALLLLAGVALSVQASRSRLAIRESKAVATSG